jgi:hypothetical protein
MTATKSSLTKSERAKVYRRFQVYRNTGTVGTGRWVYQPHDFDSSFELWSATYKTRREAVRAAFDEMVGAL